MNKGIVLVDIQEAYREQAYAGPNWNQMVESVGELLRIAGEQDIPVAILEQARMGAQDPRIREMLLAVPQTARIERDYSQSYRFCPSSSVNAFTHTGLGRILEGWHIEELVLAGASLPTLAYDVAEPATKRGIVPVTEEDLVAHIRGRTPGEIGAAIRWMREHGRYESNCETFFSYLRADIPGSVDRV